jgi:F0F1-type ATP synthase gamma subunit
VSGEVDELAEHRRTIERLVPFLDAIRSIAAIAWRRAEQRVAALADYQRRLDAKLVQVAAGRPTERWLPDPTRAAVRGPVALLLVTSERGRCGGFNDQLIAAALGQARQEAARGKTVQLLCLGDRGRSRLATTGQALVYARPLPSLTVPTHVEIEAIALDLLDLYARERWAELRVVHHAPVRRFQYAATAPVLLPPRLPPAAPTPSGVPRFRRGAGGGWIVGDRGRHGGRPLRMMGACPHSNPPRGGGGSRKRLLGRQSVPMVSRSPS